MRKIVFDIETSNIFQEVGNNDPVNLDIAVVGIFDSDTSLYSVFLQDELSRLRPILEIADMLITFNGDHFDIPLLDKYYPGDLFKIKSVEIKVHACSNAEPVNLKGISCAVSTMLLAA